MVDRSFGNHRHVQSSTVKVAKTIKEIQGDDETYSLPHVDLQSLIRGLFSWRQEKDLDLVSEMDRLFQKTAWVRHSLVRAQKVFILKELQQQQSHKSLQKKLSVDNRGSSWNIKQRTLISWERLNILYIFKQGWEAIRLSWIFMLIFNSWE